MAMSPEVVQKIKKTVDGALRAIGAEHIEKKVALAVKFAMHQPQVTIQLDGAEAVGMAVDIATVFSLEGNERKCTDATGAIRTVETVRALSVVIIGETVSLCKCAYDVICGPTYETAQFVNIVYYTTTVDMLTEKYIC